MCFVQRRKKSSAALGVLLGCLSASLSFGAESEADEGRLHSTWDVVVISAQTRYWEARAAEMSARARYAGAHAQLTEAKHPEGQRASSTLVEPTRGDSVTADTAPTAQTAIPTAPPWELVSVGRRADGRASAKIRINDHIKVVRDGDQTDGYTVGISKTGQVTVKRYRQVWEL